MVYSVRWYRVAGLKPRLAETVRVRRQHLRGETWYVLSGQGAGRSVRLNASAYAIAGRFDGQVNVQRLWDQLLAAGADPPTQDEVIELIVQLREAALLHFDAGAEGVLPARTGTPSQRPGRSLLAWRIPLADPSALLDRLAPLARMLFSRPAAAVWAVAAGLLLLLALQNAPTLADHGGRWLATPRFAMLALLAYVPIKLIHELSHGLAIRRWGGSVRRAGVTIMFGLPVPWVDAAAATGFARRYQRIVVGAAGMLAEIALAAVALPLWLVLPEGIARDAAFVTLFITGVSTLLFNANPLQRLDGYYIVTDVFDLPNLAPRSRQWWLEQLQRRLLRLPGAEPMAVARGESKWLALYAPLAWLYGLVIAAAGILWLGRFSFALGLLGALLLGWQMALRPLLRLLSSLRRQALAQRSSAQRWRRLAASGAALLVLALLVPLPQRVQVRGVVWPPDAAQLRADEDGFVVELHVADGEHVDPGAVVLELSNPALRTRLARQEARVGALEAELVQALPGRGRTDGGSGELPRAGDAQAELERAQSELDRLHERVAALTLRAQAAGRVALPNTDDLPGSYLRRGQLVGQVLGDTPATIRVALPESDARDLLGQTESVSVRLAASAWQVHPAQLLREAAGAIRQLPSAALSQRRGGPIATDPQDPHDLQTLQPVVLLDVRLGPSAAPPLRLGERAWVRVDAGVSPWGWQLARSLQRALMRRFNPQF